MCNPFFDAGTYQLTSKGLPISACELTITQCGEELIVEGNVNDPIKAVLQRAKKEGLIHYYNTCSYTYISNQDTATALLLLAKVLATDLHKIKILTLQISNGYVSITGEVFLDYDKSGLIHFLKKNVCLVEEDIKIIDSTTVNACELQIYNALRHTGIVGLNRVKVSVEEDRIFLDGYVYSIAEKEEATQIALAAGKGKKLENRLQTEAAELVF